MCIPRREQTEARRERVECTMSNIVTRLHKNASESVDESIVAFATIREQVTSSHPSFGDWRTPTPGTAYTYDLDVVPVMVEVSRGSPNKYEVEKDTGMLVLDRVLHSAVHYPGDYGYIPATLCGDGDPLDLLIISPYSAQASSLEPGTIANCRIVGMMDMEDEAGRDEKIIGVLEGDTFSSHITDLESIPPHLTKEIEHFFESYKLLEKKDGKPKWAKVLGWFDKQKALQVLEESRKRHERKKREQDVLPQRFQQLWSPNMLHCQQTPDIGVLCYINSPKGGTVSYGYRHDTSFRHYRHTLNLAYPASAGWMCQTWQQNVKKPMDVLVLSVFSVVSETLVYTRLIGFLKRSYTTSTGQKCEDYKMLAVPIDDPRGAHLSSLDCLNKSIVQRYEQFVTHTAEQNGATDVRIIARGGAQEAQALYDSTNLAYHQEFVGRKVTNAPNLWCLPWAESSDSKKLELPAVIECPKGTCMKYEFCKELGSLVLRRPLYSATHWPGNYGFIPQTVAEDGRPVNVLVLSNHPLNEVSMCNVRVVGAVVCTDEKGPDVKVVAVPKKEPRMAEWDDVTHVPSHIKSEIVNFFNTYKSLESEWRFCKVQGWKSAAETQDVCFDFDAQQC